MELVVVARSCGGMKKDHEGRYHEKAMTGESNVIRAHRDEMIAFCKNRGEKVGRERAQTR